MTQVLYWTPVKPARSRDGQRRRTAVVTYDPAQAQNTLEYDDLGTMSDLELPSFQRGGFMRTSLPIVKSASTSLERPLGLVFLVYGDQTKKSLLPNEITTLDTVRALFVRAFPDLSLDMLESPRRKIYILDPATSIYFQLEDLAEIKDRSVLKIHETDSDEPQKVKEKQEVRGRTVQMPSRPHSRQGYAEMPAGHMDTYSNKAQSLPHQPAHAYPEMMQEHRNLWEVEQRSRSRTPEPNDRPRSLSAGSSKQRYSHSPERMATPPDRGPHLNPIPENRQPTPGYREQHPGFYDTVYRGGGGGSAYPNAIYDIAPATYQQGYGPPPAMPQGQPYVARSTRAAPIAHPQRAVAPGPDIRESGTRSSNRHSLAFAPMSPSSSGGEGGFQRSQSHRLPPTERDVPELNRANSVDPVPANFATRNRIEQMEAQLATLTAWVHTQKANPSAPRVTPPPRILGSCTSDSSDTFPASSASNIREENVPTPFSSISSSASTNHIVPKKGLSSDIPDGSYHVHHIRSSGESTPISSHAELQAKFSLLKHDLHVLRRQQQINMEAMRDEISNTFKSIKTVLSSVPGAEHQVNVHNRIGATEVKKGYLDEKQHVDKELSDLEQSVEELRTDVISRQCRVNMADVEGMALLLSNVTKTLADLKARFPEIHGQMKQVMDSELKVVVKEEKFLKEEPNEIENSLRRCKKVTGTLYTLKRLASVQDNRPPQVPSMPLPSENQEGDPTIAVLDNIKALVPDHDQRVQHMEAAEAARERKKKISTQQEALKFGKSLEMASKNLRRPSDAGDKIIEDGTYSAPAQPAQPSGLKPAIPSKPAHLNTPSSPPAHSSACSNSSLPTVSTATITTAKASSPSPSISSCKVSFTASMPSSAKTTDKPTATVSAMTSTNTPATNTVSTIASSQYGQSVIKAVSLPLAEMSSTVQSGTGAVTQTVKVDNKTSVMTTSTTNTVSPSSPIKRPVFTKPPGMGVNKSPTKGSVSFDKLSGDAAPPKQHISKVTDTNVSKDEVTTAMSEPKSVTNVSPPNGDIHDSQKGVNGHSETPATEEKIDLAAQKQAARSAFFSSMKTPPTSPKLQSPKRNSALLDQGPIVRPGPNAKITSAGVAAKVTPGPTINLVFSGSVNPKSPKSPGSFDISPSKDFSSIPLPTPAATTVSVSSKKVTSPINSPTRSSFTAPPTRSSFIASPTRSSFIASPTRSSFMVSDKCSDPPSPTHSSNSSDTQVESEVTMRNKKVPPPPPPRKGSRPTSANLSPVNGGTDSQPQSEESTPRFVGGVLGQHRSSGGPLSSTPKPLSQQNPYSIFQKDIASGLYANMNRPDLQSQTSTPQQMLYDAKSPLKSQMNNKKENPSVNEDYPMPPPPRVTMALDRDERESSSESTSSSSGTSMGSQQSVVSVVRSASSAQSPISNKPRPDPPRRHSSLLAKFTGSRDPTPTMNNGKANVNGVDL